MRFLKYLGSVFREKTKGRSPHWPIVRKEWLKKHPVCQACGHDSNLQVHHKKPFHLDPELEIDPENFITLCMGPKLCHLYIGHGDNWEAYNPDVAADALEMLQYPTRYGIIVERAKRSRILVVAKGSSEPANEASAE